MIRKGKVFKCCIIVLVLFGVLFCTMSVKAETLQKNTFGMNFIVANLISGIVKKSVVVKTH